MNSINSLVRNRRNLIGQVAGIARQLLDRRVDELGHNAQSGNMVIVA
jgi:hypothetical protein